MEVLRNFCRNSQNITGANLAIWTLEEQLFEKCTMVTLGNFYGGHSYG